MNKLALNEILDRHSKWVRCDPDGKRASLSMADLCGADLSRANLYGANLCGANLSRANLSMTNLSMANLCGANLCGSKNVPFIPMTCPDSGSYIAYKKASGFVVVLNILPDALRSSANSRKCRASKAEVVRIENLDGSPVSNDINFVHSDYDHEFIYKVGEIVEVPDFDTDRWNECAPGIHHFINRQEAVDYDT